MSCPQPFSDVTKKYLCRFYEILDTMIEKMTCAELTDSLSHNFIVQMIPHHQGAIRMSENALRYPICAELRPILQAIIVSQKKGVRQIQHLLSCLGGEKTGG